MYIFEMPFNVGAEKKNLLIVFYGDAEFLEMNFSKTIETEFQKFRVEPDQVIFIFPNYLSVNVSTHLASMGPFYDSLTRYWKSPVSVVKYDEWSNLSILYTHGPVIVSGDLADLRTELISIGLTHLVEKHKQQVIMKSPSGTVFMKPSGDEFDEFIRAGGLAVGGAEHQFVAFSLLSKRPQISKLKKIYIDSSSISGFSESIISSLNRFKPLQFITYDSFSSYEGRNDAKPDMEDNVWVIISASRSNNLGRKMAREWGLRNDQVITVLSYTEPDKNNVGDEILLNISNFSDSAQKEKLNGALTKVKMVGEHFTAEASTPHPVMIKSTHKPKSVSAWIDPFNNSGVIKCNFGWHTEESPYPIYVDFEQALLSEKAKKLKEWLSDITEWYMPKNVKWITYDESVPGAKTLARMLTDLLRDNGVTEHKAISFSEAENSIEGAGTVIAVSPVLTSGEPFLRLNRNLRISKHTGNRIFISPFVVMGSKEDFNKTKNSLLYGPKGLKYQFYSKYEVFTGFSSDLNSWKAEHEVLNDLHHSFWNKRAEKLRKCSLGLQGCIGIHSSSPDNKLEFTPDFAFWKEGYDSEYVDQEAVFLTFAATMQGLREKRLTEFDSDSLYSHVYQHSVIAPDNFTRFNDGLLQSSLWRAASPRELDYRSSKELSESFSSILKRLISDNVEGGDNSAVDLLMGLATGYIRLHGDILERLLIEARSKYQDKGWEHVVELTEYMLLNTFDISFDQAVEMPI